MKHLTVVILFAISSISWGQIGGNQTFQFLNFVQSARVSAAGGYLLSVYDDDATLGQENPALLNESMSGQLNLNYVNYFADSDYGFASYTKHFEGKGTFNASLLYANYGKFDYADAWGVRDGSQFTANDLALSIGYGRKLTDNLSIGISQRIIASFYERYSALGTSSDIGLVYHNEEDGFGAALVAKNIGFQFKGYTQNNREALPLNMALALSKKLAHAPFRFSLTYDHLERFDLLYFNDSVTTEIDALTGELIQIKPPGFLAKAMQHVSVGVELLMSKNLHLRLGYNHRLRTLSTFSTKPGYTGFALGMGFKVKKYHLSYALNKSHIAGTENHITITRKF